MDKILHSARIIGEKVLALKPKDKVLIIANPRTDLLKISTALAKVAKEMKATAPDLSMVPQDKIVNEYVILQPKKTAADYKTGVGDKAF